MICIRTLVLSGIRPQNVIEADCSVNRSVSELACPVWHPALIKNYPKKLKAFKNGVSK
jgi:hypothetical protein